MGNLTPTLITTRPAASLKNDEPLGDADGSMAPPVLRTEEHAQDRVGLPGGAPMRCR